MADLENTRLSSNNHAVATRFGNLAATHRIKKLGIALGGLDLVEQEFHGGEVVHRVTELAQHPHFLQDVGLEQ